jgi:type IV pilus assembly protein PilF
MLVKMYPHSFEAKQYMLNQLIEIEEDKLAREYAQTMKPKKKKRVVKLKPKKQTSELPTQLEVPNEQKVTKVETKKVNDVADKASSEAESAEQLIKKITNETVATQQDESEKLSQTVVVDKKDDIKENKVEPKVQSVAKTNEGQDVISLPFHLVKKGESLFAISKRYNIQLRSLMRWNGLNSKSIINIGDVIYLADPKKAAKARG